MIILKFRNGSLNLPKKVFESIYNFEWYLSKLINYDYDNDNEIEIWEDKEAVLSILDSIKFNTLIIYNNVNIDYLLQLCNYWCVPEWLINDINIKKNVLKLEEYQRKINLTFDNKSKICKLCNCGFKEGENTSNSCKRHKNGFNNSTNKYYCCQQISFDDYCCIGYHVY